METTETMESNPHETWTLLLSLSRRHYGVFVIFFAFFFWRFLSSFVASVAPLLHLAANKKHDWKLKNLIISLIHSTLTGLGGLICFFLDPDMAKDLINHHHERCYILAAISIGYFIHDFLDLSKSKKSEWELQLHHIIVLLCFGSAVFSKQYIGYNMVAFLIEINSMFLHIRSILQVCGVSKFSLSYRVNSLFNIGTFIVNRIMVLAWMTRWIIINKDSVPLVLYTLGCVANAILTLMNSMLLYRLLRADQMVITSTLLGKKEIIAENSAPIINTSINQSIITAESNPKQKDS
jgi:hypothetical protein